MLSFVCIGAPFGLALAAVWFRWTVSAFAQGLMRQFRAFLDPVKLVGPEALEHASPLMERPNGLSIRAI
jgi:hypothetical protein